MAKMWESRGTHRIAWILLQLSRPGANEITIKVVNAWVNRLIGDEQPGATKITFADVKPYKADSPLLPSGLLGPVQIMRAVENGSDLGQKPRFSRSQTGSVAIDLFEGV